MSQFWAERCQLFCSAERRAVTSDRHKAQKRRCQVKQPKREIGSELTLRSPYNLCPGRNSSGCPKRKLDKAGQTDQDLPKKSNPAPFRIRPASPARPPNGKVNWLADTIDAATSTLAVGLQWVQTV